jgi:uncharacterized membrane protein
MEKLLRIVIFLVFVVVIYLVYSRVINAIRGLRVRKGLDTRATIVVKDDETELFNNAGQLICSEQNIVVYRGKRLLLIGSSGDINKLENKISEGQLNKRNFIRECDTVCGEIRDFWYHYVTYYVLKFKAISGISMFPIPSVSLRVEVSLAATRDRIKLELEKAKTIKKPRLYNILDIA